MPSQLTNPEKETAKKVAYEVTEIVAFLKRNKIIKTQKEIAKHIQRDPSAITRSMTDTESMLSTAEKVRDELLKYYNLVLSNGAVLLSEKEEMKSKIEHTDDLKIDSYLVGNYELQWKKVNYSLHIVANILINPNGSVIFTVEDEIFKGTAVVIKTMLHLELQKMSEIGVISEAFDISFDIGNTHNPLKYIGGIIKAVENRMTMLYAAFCLLIRRDNAIVNQEIIDTFFVYTQSKNCLEFDDNIKQILDTRQDIEQTKQKIPVLNHNYCPLEGKWDSIVKIKMVSGSGVRVGKLTIISNKDVLHTGTWVGFSQYSGEVVITGGYDLYIYLRSDKKHATLVANVGYSNVLGVKQILGTYITASPYEKRGVITGTFYLIKANSDMYIDSPPGEYDSKHKIYQYYEEKGLIQKLERKYSKTEIKDS
jgi:hypothetical protein